MIFFRESKGQVFTIDMALALIIITVIIGMSANAMDVVNYKISDYSAGKSLERIATDASDILINTPGTHNWENSNNNIGVTPGLAQDEDSGKKTIKVLNYAKINRLKAGYTVLMGNVVPWGGSSSLTIYPINSTLEPIQVGNKTPSASVTEIVAVNRTVLVNFTDFKTLVIVGSTSEICPHYNYNKTTAHYRLNYNNSTAGWNCMPFQITQEDLNTCDI